MFDFSKRRTVIHSSKSTDHLATLFRSVYNRKLIITSCFAGSLGLSLAVFALATPIYEASVSLVVGQSGSGDMWDATRRSKEMVTSQARIAESEEVLRGALKSIGIERLNAALESNENLIIRYIPVLAPIFRHSISSDLSMFERAIQIAKEDMRVIIEAQSDIIQISYRNESPQFAAEFANALAQSFIDRQNDLSSKPGVAEFFHSKAMSFDSQINQTAFAFQDFVKKHKSFSIEEQRALLLKRNSDAINALAATRSSLAAKLGEKNALVSQLKLLRPVTLTPYVSTLVDSLASEDKAAIKTGQGASPNDRQIGLTDPPLLMVRVYQDLMVTLFKLNSEVVGLKDLGKQQETEVASIEKDLLDLSENEREFNRLRRDVNLAVQNAEIYAKKTVEEQVSSDIIRAKISNVKIVQPARVPLRPVYPRGRVVFGAGLCLGMILSAGFIMLLDAPFASKTKAEEMVAQAETVTLDQAAQPGAENSSPNQRHRTVKTNRSSNTSSRLQRNETMVKTIDKSQKI